MVLKLISKLNQPPASPTEAEQHSQLDETAEFSALQIDSCPEMSGVSRPPELLDFEIA